MADHIGIVTATESGNFARVMTNRRGGCGGCQSALGGYRSCLADARSESRAVNPVRAEAGDMVRVHLSTAGLYVGAAILYLLPVFGMLTGAAIGVWLSSVLGLTETAASIGGVMIGLAGGFALGMLLDRLPAVHKKTTPIITGIISSSGGKKKNCGCAGC